MFQWFLNLFGWRLAPASTNKPSSAEAHVEDCRQRLLQEVLRTGVPHVGEIDRDGKFTMRPLE